MPGVQQNNYLPSQKQQLYVKNHENMSEQQLPRLGPAMKVFNHPLPPASQRSLPCDRVSDADRRQRTIQLYQMMWYTSCGGFYPITAL